MHAYNVILEVIMDQKICESLLLFGFPKNL